LVAVILATPVGAAAQAPADRYLLPTSWTQPFLDHLDRAGTLRGLDPLTRPLRRGAVASSIADAEFRADDEITLGTLRLLAREFDEPDSGGTSWVLDARAGISGASDASRWTLRPQTEDARLYPVGALEAVLRLPHVVVTTVPELDNRLKYDTLYTGKQDRVIAGRAGTAYVLASWNTFDAFFGLVDRNWGPPEAEGLLVSSAPYSTEHLALRIGPERLRLEMTVAQLDTLVPWDSVTPVTRWVVAHRLVVRPTASLALSLGESVVQAGTGTPWRYFNPVTLGLLTNYDGGDDANALLSADVVWQAAARLRLFGQVLVDDIQVDDNAQSDQEPPAYGFTAGASGGLAAGRVAWTVLYTRVSNLAYRTPRREHQYTSRRIGLARNWSDYDEATARATFLAAPGLLLGAGLTLQRQGEGDIRERYPAVSAFADSLAFLTGTVERSVQPSVELAWAPSPWVSVTASGAWRSTSNAGHVAGTDDDRMVWRIGVILRRRYLGRILD
jgi:hypothetical protein